MKHLIKNVEQKVSSKYQDIRSRAYLALGNFLLSTRPKLDHNTILNTVAEMEIKGLAPYGITFDFNSLSTGAAPPDFIKRILSKYLTPAFYESLRAYMASAEYGKPIEPEIVKGLIPKLNPARTEEELSRMDQIYQYSARSALNHPIKPVRPKIEIVEADRPQDEWVPGKYEDTWTQLELPFDD